MLLLLLLLFILLFAFSCWCFFSGWIYEHESDDCEWIDAPKWCSFSLPHIYYWIASLNSGNMHPSLTPDIEPNTTIQIKFARILVSVDGTELGFCTWTERIFVPKTAPNEIATTTPAATDTHTQCRENHTHWRTICYINLGNAWKQ